MGVEGFHLTLLQFTNSKEKKEKFPFQCHCENSSGRTQMGLAWISHPLFRLITITGVEAYDWLFPSHKPTPRQDGEVIDSPTKLDWRRRRAIT